MQLTGHRLRLVGAVATMLVLAACGDAPTGLDGECRGSGGVVFSVTGSLSTASSPFSRDAEVSGCLRITEETARPGAESSDPADVLGFELRVGSELWAGDGYTMAPSLSAPLRGGGVHLEVWSDGTGLVFSGRGEQPSEPGGYYFLLHAPGTETTHLTIQSGHSPFPEVGAGDVGFIR